LQGVGIVSADRGEYVFAITIEGLGVHDDLGNADLIRWCSRSITTDPSNLYIEALIGWPESLESTLDLRIGSGQRVTVGAGTFVLQGTVAVLSRMFRTDAPARLSRLAAPIELGDANTTLEDTGLTTTGDRLILVEREVMILGAETPAFTYDLTHAGECGTAARAHPIGAADDVDVFDADHFTVPWARVVKLYLVPLDAADYTEEVLIDSWVLRTVDIINEAGDVSLGCDAALALVLDRKLLQGQYTAERTTQDVEEGAAYYSATYQGYREPAAGAFAGGGVSLFSHGGAGVTTGDWGGPFADSNFDTHIQVRSDEHVAVPGSPDEWATLLGESTIHEVFTTWPGAPLLNDSATATKARLATHCIDRVHQVLVTSRPNGLGSGGYTSDYDLGIEMLGCGVPESLLDEASFLAAERRIGDDGIHEHVWLGVEGEPVDAYATMQSWLAPHGAALVPGTAGMLAIAFLADVALGDEVEITEDLVVSVQHQSLGIDGPYDLVRVLYDQRPGKEARFIETSDGKVLRRRLHSDGSQAELDVGFIGGLDAYERALELGARHLSQWHAPLASYTVTVIPTAAMRGLGLGARVLLTHGAIPVAGAGTRGISSGLCLITAATRSLGSAGFSDGDPAPDEHALEITFRLLYVGGPYANVGLFAPAGIVVSTTATSITVGSDYSSAPFAGQAYDTHRFQVGDAIQCRTRDRATARVGYATITGLPGGGVIEVDALPGGTIAGDVVELMDYDTAGVLARDANVFLADAGETLGAGSIAANQWTGP
jgi:hypothetical protein